MNMTKKELEEMHKNFPEILTSPIIMEEPNTPIPIFQGTFKLKRDETEIELKGKIQFVWFPNSGTIFSGFVINRSSDILKEIQSNEIYQLIVDGLPFGECLISNFTLSGASGDIELVGTITGCAVKGDKSIPVEKIVFTIPNFRDFLGLPVKRVSVRGLKNGRNRLLFENDKYTIIIDKGFDYKDKKKSLSSNGGYILLYTGELKKKKGNLTLENSQEIFHCFATFLSFLNGRRISPIFRTGYFEDKIIWSDYTDYIVDQYKAVISWPQTHSINGLNELWQAFTNIWKNEEDNGFLISAIHWYIEANSHSGYTEGSIIMAQTGLELIYNWLLIENKKLLIGKDAENISASNKIRLLLAHLNIDTVIPNNFSHLQSLPDIMDAPESFVQIRNAIVHSQEEKRKKLTKMHYRAKYEALQIGVWWLELSLLFILEYKGVYVNRCSPNNFEAKKKSDFFL